MAWAPERAPDAAVERAAAALDAACRRSGFFYAYGHGVSPALFERLEAESRRFFALDVAEKMKIRMALGGRAWRGYFPVGDELTAGRPDLKEGLYFGSELAAYDPRVVAGRPLHGPNLFPASVPGLKSTVLEYLDAMAVLGHAVMAGLALGLGLEPTHFRRRFMSDPLTLFRVFHYP
ncbi:MAG: 2-oxoglutarate and iron-dependent oxygenase domain-containing protein, partial [Acidobacteriota bacterium]